MGGRSEDREARPTGTMTFLFTDVEGSTKLWALDPAAMSVSLRLHDSILGAAIEGHVGYVFTAVGDSFAAAFQDRLRHATRPTTKAPCGLGWSAPTSMPYAPSGDQQRSCAKHSRITSVTGELVRCRRQLDGDASHRATGCPFQAWSVAELFRERRSASAVESAKLASS